MDKMGDAVKEWQQDLLNGWRDKQKGRKEEEAGETNVVDVVPKEDESPKPGAG